MRIELKVIGFVYQCLTDQVPDVYTLPTTVAWCQSQTAASCVPLPLMFQHASFHGRVLSDISFSAAGPRLWNALTLAPLYDIQLSARLF